MQKSLSPTRVGSNKTRQHKFKRTKKFCQFKNEANIAQHIEEYNINMSHHLS